MLSTLPGVLALYGVLAVWIAVLLAYLASWNNLRVEVELHHTELWRRLGSPPFSGFATNYYSFLRFVLAGNYREVGDPTLTRLGDRARLLAGVVLLVWCAVMAVYFRFVVFR
jgi:hypothetical protein